MRVWQLKAGHSEMDHSWWFPEPGGQGTQVLLVVWGHGERKRLSEVGLECADCISTAVWLPDPGCPCSALLYGSPRCFRTGTSCHVEIRWIGFLPPLWSKKKKKRQTNIKAGSGVCECHEGQLKRLVALLIAELTVLFNRVTLVLQLRSQGGAQSRELHV